MIGQSSLYCPGLSVCTISTVSCFFFSTHVSLSFTVIQIEYHKKFEEERGHYTSVPDDPETLRAQKSSSMASQVAYSHHSSGQSRLGIQQRSEAGKQ